MPVYNDFEERFTSRLSGICSIGDPNDFDGWGPNDNGTPSGGGNQGNGGEGYGDPTQQRADAGSGYAPDGGFPSRNKPGVGGSNNPPTNSSGGDNQDKGYLTDREKDILQNAACVVGCLVILPPKDIFVQAACNYACNTIGDGPTPTGEYKGTPPPPAAGEAYPVKYQPPQKSSLPTHPNYKTSGYAIDGYDRIFMYGDHTHYSISGLKKVTGYQPPSGKELVKWYGTTYAIPDAAARRRRFG